MNSARISMFLVVGVLGMTMTPSGPASADAAKEIQFDGQPLKKWLGDLKSAKDDERKKAQDALLHLARAKTNLAAEVVTAFLDAVPKADENNVQILQSFGPLLFEIGPAAARELHPHLWGNDKEKKLKAILGLTLLGRHAKPAVPGLVTILENEKDEVIQNALIGILRSHKVAAFAPELIRRLDDKDLQRAVYASFILLEKEYPSTSLLPAISRRLRGDDDDKRFALRLLQRMGRDASPMVAEVNQLLDKGQLDPHDAAWLLGEIGPPAAAAVPALEKLLKHDKESTANATARALCLIGDHAQAKERLLKNLKADDAEEIMATVPVLWNRYRSPETVGALVGVIKNGKPVERKSAAQIVGRLGPNARDAVPALIGALDGKDDQVTLEAIQALGRIGPDAKAALEPLRKFAADKDSSFQVYSALALPRIELDAKSIAAVTGLFKSDDSNVRVFALQELAFHGPNAKASLPDVRKCLDDPKPDVRVRAVEACWRIDRDPETMSRLRKMLRERGPVQTDAALSVGALFHSDAEPAVDDLIAALWTDPDSSTAPQSLGWIGPAAKRAVPALRQLIRQPDLEDHMYSAAAEALGFIGPDAKLAVDDLVKLLEHENPYARIHAALALWRIDQNKKGEAVIERSLLSRDRRTVITALEVRWLTKKEDRTIDDLIAELRVANFSDEQYASNHRFLAARALGNIGPAAKRALPDLKDFLYDEDPELRRYVREAIGKIEGKK